MSSLTLYSTNPYPEREEVRERWYDRLDVWLSTQVIPWVKTGEAYHREMVARINLAGEALPGIDDREILETARKLGKELRKNGFADDLVVEAFALIREAAAQKTGLRPFDVQLIGGLVLLHGMLAEMETGEGKTLTATLPACTAALAGIPVHIVTVNDYLAERDAQWMGPLYQALGMTVGVIKQGMDPAQRQAAYRCDVTYCTNKEVAFDYLKDRIVMWDRPSTMRLQLERLYGEGSRAGRLLMRGLHFAIVDEADSILIDEARTPLIISSSPKGTPEQEIYQQALDLAKSFERGVDFEIFESHRAVDLKESGRKQVEMHEWPGIRSWTNHQQRVEVVRQALSALHLFILDKQYLIRDGKVQIIDEYTGRVMPDRSWEMGLHQLIEIKENCEPTSRKETQARISYQRFFRRYCRLAGMTGTAREVSRELWRIYRLRVVSIPTNRPLQRSYLPDRIFPTADDKWDTVVGDVLQKNREGRPVLVGTRSVGASEHLSALLATAGVAHRVLNARQDKEEADIVAQAGQPGQVTVATNMAGRGTDIRLDAGIADIGGLHVIATERHESGRIDRQLFGRTARQGDPGTCQAFVSIQDELITMYVKPVIRRLCSAFMKTPLGLQPGSRFLFWLAQLGAERQHSRTRRNLLKMDKQTEDALAFSGKPE
jgi:preprotein translocase subunit SecA